MGFSVHWSWLIALSCLLCMGGEVWCDCTDTKIEIEGGHYTLTKGLHAGSMVVYQCPEGYYPYPALTRLCQANGSWRPAPKRFTPQRCRLVECPDPNVLENGNVSPPQEKYFVDNETTYECYYGYTMRGSTRRVCLPNGKWSGSTPICSRDSGDHCADPGIPAGSSRTGNIFGIDNTVSYSCNGNLFLVGSSERVCQENGQWSGTEPACYYKHTYDTSLEVSQAFGSAIMDTLTTLQSINDTQQGRKIRIPKNETLNIYIAVDISESINGTYVSDSKKAITQLIQKLSYFNMDLNYDILFFSSEIYKIVNILDFFDQEIELNTVLKEVQNFQVGDKNIGTNLNLVFKTFEERMAAIKTRVGDEAFKEHRHVLIIFSDGAYNMGGSPAYTVKRIQDMVYMNQTSDRDDQSPSREEYLDIYIFAIGDDIFDDYLKTLALGTGGKHYFRMKDINNLAETFNDIIDEQEVMGLCGLHRDYATDEREHKRKMYPWVAFIDVRLKTGGKSKKCLGSLVSPDFVLTAAHCLPFGTNTEDVTVEIHDGNGKDKKIKMFKIHENYNLKAKVDEKVKEFYDYDVALILLDTPVQISITARPICIPCTQTTSDALKLVGVSTCRQQEQLLLKNHLERLTFLTKTSNIVEEKDVYAKLGRNRDECIRHALQAPGIETDKPEVAVTDNFLCTGGLYPYIDHIACAGDSGGAVFKNYEQRTIQIALVSWGTKQLCTTDNIPKSDAQSRDFHINLFRVVPFLKSVLGNDNQNDFAPLKFLEN